MRAAILVLCILTLLAATPALACKCMPDTYESEAALILSDSSVSVVDVYVRDVDNNNKRSTLDIKALYHGRLADRHIRARLGKTSCDVNPVAHQTMMLAIRAERDGTYSILGDCAYDAILKHFGRKRYSMRRSIVTVDASSLLMHRHCKRRDSATGAPIGV